MIADPVVEAVEAEAVEAEAEAAEEEEAVEAEVMAAVLHRPRRTLHVQFLRSFRQQARQAEDITQPYV